MPKNERTQNLLVAMAQSNPDYTAYSSDLPLPTSAASQTLPPELTEDVITVLREVPENALTIDKWRNDSMEMRNFSFTGGAVTTAVVLFLLRSHIRIHRREDGSWEFFMESKPSQNNPVSEALKRILDWLKDIGIFP